MRIVRKGILRSTDSGDYILTKITTPSDLYLGTGGGHSASFQEKLYFTESEGDIIYGLDANLVRNYLDIFAASNHSGVINLKSNSAYLITSCLTDSSGGTYGLRSYAFDSELNRTNLTTSTPYRNGVGMGTIGGKVLLVGGEYPNPSALTRSNLIEHWDTELTKGTLTYPITASNIRSASLSNRVIFAGGVADNSGNNFLEVYSYNSSLTRTTLSSLTNVVESKGAEFNGKAYFILYNNTLEIYNSSGIKETAIPVVLQYYGNSLGSSKDFLGMGGGAGSWVQQSNAFFYLNKDNILTAGTNLGTARGSTIIDGIGNFLIVARGSYTTSSGTIKVDTIDIYEKTKAV